MDRCDCGKIDFMKPTKPYFDVSYRQKGVISSCLPRICIRIPIVLFVLM